MHNVLRLPHVHRTTMYYLPGFEHNHLRVCKFKLWTQRAEQLYGLIYLLLAIFLFRTTTQAGTGWAGCRLPPLQVWLM